MTRMIMIALLLLSIGSTNAQTLEKGDNIINLGIGFDPYFHYAKGPGYKRTAVGPIVVSYEHILTDKLGIGRIGVGALIGQSFYRTRYSNPNYYTPQPYNNSNYYNYQYRASRTSVIGRAAYHFDIPVKGLDIYAGLGMGFHVSSNREKRYYYNGQEYWNERWVRAHFAFDIYAGIRYYFNETIGIYAEFGYGVSAVSGGVSFKF